MIFKFGTVQGALHVEHIYDNVYEHENYEAWSRVTIAPSKNQIALMLDIANTWEGPYGILYVLTASRLGRETARYQSPQPCSWEDLKRFAYTFQKYFEEDGRHHIWFRCESSGAKLVYDNHNLIYSYGNDREVIALLKSKGFKEGEPQIPAPHAHWFNPEYDAYEDEIMKYFGWLEFPLQEEHDDP